MRCAPSANPCGHAAARARADNQRLWAPLRTTRLKEFACPLGQTSRGDAANGTAVREEEQQQHANAFQVYNYMRWVLPYLDATPWVERYAWFAPRTEGSWLTQHNSLLAEDSSALLPLGEMYASLNLSACSPRSPTPCLSPAQDSRLQRRIFAFCQLQNQT
jgi:hypothetical protein